MVPLRIRDYQYHLPAHTIIIINRERRTQPLPPGRKPVPSIIKSSLTGDQGLRLCVGLIHLIGSTGDQNLKPQHLYIAITRSPREQQGCLFQFIARIAEVVVLKVSSCGRLR